MLTATKIEKAKPKEKPYKLFDARGVFLQVTPAGSKLWRLKYYFEGREKLYAMGRYPEVTLKMARDRAAEARRLLEEGADPVEHRKVSKSAQAVTFKLVAEEWLEKQAKTWSEKNTRLVRSRLESYIYPLIGNRPIDNLEPTDVLPVVRKIEARGATETAKRSLAVCGRVFRYGVATGRVKRDPTADLKGVVAATTPKHRAAITDPQALGGFLRAADDYEGRYTTAAGLKLLPLLFARPGELRSMAWADIKGDAWEIPGEKMKSGLPHIVPLAKQAREVLEQVREINGHGDLVFPSDRDPKRPISDNTLTAALRRMGFTKSEVVPHGFRATARTLLAEILHERIDLIEHQLAHTVRDPLGRAYNRTQFLPERKAMMQRWADYLDLLKKSD